MRNRACISKAAILAPSVIVVLSVLFFQGTISAQGPVTISLKVAWFPVVHVELLFVAIDKGLFEEEGLKVEPIQLQGGGPRQLERQALLASKLHRGGVA